MKILLVNECDRYCFPRGIETLKEFIKYANLHYSELIPLHMLVSENCVHPYYIEEDIKLFYVNVSKISNITDEEVHILSRSEYEQRLSDLMQSFCVNCVNYEEELDEDNLKGHREKLCLDGSCWGFEKIELL